jgi:hypothetical protein
MGSRSAGFTAALAHDWRKDVRHPTSGAALRADSPPMIRRSVPLDESHRLEWWDDREIEPCWSVLPGGRTIRSRNGESWRYLGTVVLFPVGDPAFAQHRFRHPAHPGYQGRPCYVHIADSDLGPELCALNVGGEIVPVPRCPHDGCHRHRHVGPHEMLVPAQTTREEPTANTRSAISLKEVACQE